MINATCLTIAAVLAAAHPGDSIRLQPGTCESTRAVTRKGQVFYQPAITITDSFAKPVTIDMTGVTIKGLSFKPGAGGLQFRGGTVTAPDGLDGFAGSGYGIAINAAHDLGFVGTTVTLARKAVALTRSTNISFDKILFTNIREDGIIATLTNGLRVTNSTFNKFVPKPQTCEVPGGRVVTGQGKGACTSMGGDWTDGNHSDAIQPYNGVTNLYLGFNTVDGVSQGFGQLAGKNRRDGAPRSAETYAPLEHVVIEGNRLRVTGYHSITMTDCLDCKIINNEVEALTGGKRAPIRYYKDTGTIACGNRSKDGKAGLQPCR